MVIFGIRVYVDQQLWIYHVILWEFACGDLYRNISGNAKAAILKSFLYKNTSGMAVLAILNVFLYEDCWIFGSEFYENLPASSKWHNSISACNYNEEILIGIYENVSGIAVLTALIITRTTVYNYIIFIIITITLIKNSNNNILFKKKEKKKDFLPTVPKSLWSRLDLNLGPSSFLLINLTT